MNTAPPQHWFLFAVLAAGLAAPLAGKDGTSTENSAADSEGQLASQVQRNVEAGRRMIAQLREHREALDAEAKAELDALVGMVQSAEKRLRRSLKNVEHASADEWPFARAKLESSYEAYAQAISQAGRLVAVESSGAQRGSGGR
jgi:DNA anti-recombination protein RmuC